MRTWFVNVIPRGTLTILWLNDGLQVQPAPSSSPAASANGKPDLSQESEPELEPASQCLLGPESQGPRCSSETTLISRSTVSQKHPLHLVLNLLFIFTII